MDSDRKTRVQQALEEARLDAAVCSLPSSVLLVSGYWPVVGESVAVSVRGGPTVVVAPEDEAELAATGFADQLETFEAETVREIRSAADALRPRLTEAFKKLGLRGGRIGVDSGASSQGASYLAMHLFGDHLPDLLRDLLPGCDFVPLDRWLLELSSIKTSFELQRIRQACAIARNAYDSGTAQLRAGMTEPQAAEIFRSPLDTAEAGRPYIHRSDGFAFCMSGPNSAKAHAAYARTRRRVLEPRDLVMIHCNSYVDGLWTDITRTYTLRPPDEQQARMRAAVFAAREAAFAEIKPNARAVDADRASRRAIHDHGLGKYLKHGTGHGVGFSPMSAYTLPRIHAGSPDVLKEGMVFNVEPAVYIEGYGGLRHCDMVAVTGNGYELLTDFQSDVGSLTLRNAGAVRALHQHSGA